MTSSLTLSFQVYLRKEFRLSLQTNGIVQEVKFKTGTRCIVVRPATRRVSGYAHMKFCKSLKSLPSQDETRVNLPTSVANVNRVFYRLQLKASVYQWDITHSAMRQQLSGFEALTASEIDSYNRKQLPRNGQAIATDVLDTDTPSDAA